MSKKIIFFTLLSVSLLFSLTTIEAMKLRGLFRTPRALMARRLALPVLAAVGATYALNKDSYCDDNEQEKAAGTGVEVGSLQFSTFNPESYLKSPKPLTSEQEQESDIFKRFHMTYPGNHPEAIDSVISYIDDIELSPTFHKNGISFSNTLLLSGMPGNGKTYLVDELARASQTKVLSCIGSSLHSTFKHQSVVNVEAFFDLALNYKGKLIIFIDEFDAIAGAQVANNGMNNESIETLKALLAKVNQVKEKPNLFFIAATNHSYWLEPSIKSRMSYTAEIEAPKEKEEYYAFFKENYRKRSIVNSQDKKGRLGSSLLADIIWRQTPNILGYGDQFSRRELDEFIPKILALKKVDYKKNGIGNKEELTSIDTVKDEKYITAAVIDMRKSYKNRLATPPLTYDQKMSAIYAGVQIVSSTAQLGLSAAQTVSSIGVNNRQKTLLDQQIAAMPKKP